ncbi:small multi-drug export protein [Lysinibacillus sp. Bpr_S20]|uniref:small multi-drug export protein n=1 Tax=Lysinibacillus sp. Bpr_S20 TaxID=2933964 RepID=UPI00201204DB|nr:small multi-drug export protein [Lysinibacillus sp. Bpr_S20]MCL1700015.1 small multi-drug export protein [Lysinibacillus sp. Bpr_S20]
MFREIVQSLISQLNESNQILQYLGVFLLSFIPFVESPGGAAAGSVIGLSFILSGLIAIGGNWISVMLVIVPFNALLTNMRNRKSERQGFIQRRASKARKLYEKYGVPGLALIAPLVASGHIAAFTSLVAGADKKRVVLWHTISIIVWGVAGASIGTFINYDIMP